MRAFFKLVRWSSGFLLLQFAIMSQAIALHDLGTDRVIVKLKDNYKSEFNQSLSASRTASLSTRAGISLGSVRAMSGNAHVLALPRVMKGVDLEAALAHLRADPTVEYAYADARKVAHAIPTDPLYTSDQYYLKEANTLPGSSSVGNVNAPKAWNITTGSASIVVAVLDTGVRFDHPDLAGQLLPGYDFINTLCSTVVGAPDYSSACTPIIADTVANDGNGRDSDASDPGDGIAPSDVAYNPVLSDCSLENSTWHGTRVSGIIGARANNGIGIAGLNWNTSILPVRVLGRCGGYDSDILDAMNWAGGIAVPGAPVNTHPARVINMSLGGPGARGCPTLYVTTIAALNARGTMVVVSAGNENDVVATPANCPGVISVGAVRTDGLRTGYSNSGDLTITSSAGDYLRPFSVGLLTSTSNRGTGAPQPYTGIDANGYYSAAAGTSFSAPLVSGTLALMLAVDPTLTPSAAKDILMQTARPFVAKAGSALFPVSGYCTPGGTLTPDTTIPCNCTTSTCGAGYLDTGAAVERVQALLTTAPSPPTPAVPNPNATLGATQGGGGGGGIDGLTLGLLLALAVGLRQKWTSTRH